MARRGVDRVPDAAAGASSLVQCLRERLGGAAETFFPSTSSSSCPFSFFVNNSFEFDRNSTFPTFLGILSFLFFPVAREKHLDEYEMSL